MHSAQSSTTAAYRLRAVWMLAIVLATLVARVAGAEAYQPPERSGEDLPREVAVVSLGATTPTTWVVHLAEVFDEGDYAILHGEHLRGRLERRRVTERDTDRQARLDRLAGAFDDGIAAFHRNGNEAGIEQLATPFEEALNHPQAFAHRPRFARKLFEAGMVLVRAYRDLGREEGARGVARDLYRYLPGLEPSLARARLADIHFYYRERAAVAATGAKLTVRIAGDADCRPFVNGTPIRGRSAKVDSDRTHFVALRCGESWGPIWRVDLRPGEYATVPISQLAPHTFELAGATTRDRRRAAETLEVVTHWAEVSETIGIGRPADGQDAPYVVMRVPEDGEVTWSEVDNREAIGRAVRRLLPGVASDPIPAEVADPSNRWLDWALVAGGAAGLMGGSTLAAVTEARRGNPPKMTSVRAAYVTTLTVGAGLTTWGLLRHLGREPADAAEHTAQRPRISVEPMGKGAKATVEFTW